MHSTTKENLELLSNWTISVMNADSFVTALQTQLPDEIEGGIYHGLENRIADMYLNIFQADAVGDVKPYLRAARIAGFKRNNNKPEKNGDTETIRWRYTAEHGIKLTLTLHFRQGEDASCSYVKVGTKTVDDLQLLCGDELKAFRAQQS